MDTLKIDNTATSWHDFLSSLAAEAARDAAATDPRLTLHGVLSDLANVTRAYAGRLEIERNKEQLAGAGKSQAAGEGRQQDAALVGAPTAAADQSAGPASPSELPSWLLETLRAMGEEIEDLKRRVALLEDGQRKVEIQPSPPFALQAEDIFDEDRQAWNTVERARQALTGMVIREHKQRAATRQAILSRVASLAFSADDPTVAAEIRQHQTRAEELERIDAVAGVKLDEIAAEDELEALRAYDVKRGWP